MLVRAFVVVAASGVHVAVAIAIAIAVAVLPLLFCNSEDLPCFFSIGLS